MSRRFVSALIGAAALTLLAAAPTAAPARAQDLRYDVGSGEETLRALRGRCPASRAGCPLSSDNFRLFERAVGGERTAQHELARRLESGRAFPVSDGERLAIGWYGRAAEQGDAEAALRYNDLRTKGLASAADEARIASQLRAPAQAGDATALQALSEMYLHGRGVERSADESMRLLRRAADAGDAAAQSRLAERLRRGAPGVVSDRPSAVGVDERAATNGDIDALRRLGPMLLSGPREVRDPVRAYVWLTRAAHCELGYPMEVLVGLLTSGQMQDGRVLIAPDFVQAYMWVTIASRVYRDRRDWRAGLELEMTAAQVAEAKRRAAAWRSKPCSEAGAMKVELPPVTADSERLAILGLVPDYSRQHLIVPPGATPAPWQRIPDFDSLEDVVTVVTAIEAHCQQRRKACAPSCNMSRHLLTSGHGEGRGDRVKHWRACVLFLHS